jgi:hypothetical protein
MEVFADPVLPIVLGRFVLALDDLDCCVQKAEMLDLGQCRFGLYAWSQVENVLQGPLAQQAVGACFAHLFLYQIHLVIPQVVVE